MIEVYAFLAIFVVQVLAMSVLFPARLMRYAFAQASNIPAERIAQLYPGIDHDLENKRFQARLRAGSMGLAVLGLLSVGWMFSYMREPGWKLGPVAGLLSVYSILQFLPLLFAGLLAFRFYKARGQSLFEGRRTAKLERREIFDFISPSSVVLAVLAYALFAALAIYFQRETVPGFFLLGILTLVYALTAFDAYRALYGKRQGHIETPELRANRISLTLRAGIYGCILCAVFFACIFVSDLLDLKKWVPFAISFFFVTNTFLICKALMASPRKRGTHAD